jgi:hypothetical protein
MLLQGDELSVQLFIGAAAISTLSVAMTQAGWTHKWFVRTMFGVAVLLSCASVGWPYFGSRIPAISGGLQAMAETRIVWFFAGVVPALVIGMRVTELQRRRNTQDRLPTTWVSITEAMFKYARQDLMERYEYVLGQSADHATRGELIDAELATLGAASIFSSKEEQEEMSTRISLLKSERSAIHASFMERQESISICGEVLRDNIKNQLMTGDLLAKGFLTPHTPGYPENIIPTEEWRFLLLDDQDDKALGPDFEYIAVLIGKP